MPMWNLTEEKIAELEKQMNEKRQEYEILQKMHHFKMWENDLDQFLQELDKYEEKEERDRLAQPHGGKNAGKPKRKKANAAGN